MCSWRGGPTPGGFLRCRRRAKSAHLSWLVARDAGSLKLSIMRGRGPWSLAVCAALTHVFAIARPAGSSSAMCQPAGPWVTSESDSGLERPESAIGLVQCNLLQPDCRSAADAVWSATVWWSSVVALWIVRAGRYAPMDAAYCLLPYSIALARKLCPSACLVRSDSTYPLENSVPRLVWSDLFDCKR